VGGFYGARLAAAGHDVHFLLHSDYEHVRQHGLVLESPLGDIHIPAPNAYRRVEDMPPCDVVVVSLKTTSNHLLPSLLPPLLEHVTALVMLQNGLGNEALAAPLVGDSPLLGGLCFLCSNRVGPGHVRHLDYGRVTLAQHGAAAITPTVEAVGADFAATGVPVVLEADLELARWKKLVWNVPFNPLSVLLDALPQELLADARTRALVLDVMGEVQAGAAACGHPIPDEFLAANVADTEAMTPYRTSMKVDFDAGRPLEVDFLLDAPARAARRAGVTLPQVEALAAAVAFLDSGRPHP
jgi:2-dehydropantoate 2-reductase